MGSGRPGGGISASPRPASCRPCSALSLDIGPKSGLGHRRGRPRPQNPPDTRINSKKPVCISNTKAFSWGAGKKSRIGEAGDEPSSSVRWNDGSADYKGRYGSPENAKARASARRGGESTVEVESRAVRAALSDYSAAAVKRCSSTNSACSGWKLAASTASSVRKAGSSSRSAASTSSSGAESPSARRGSREASPSRRACARLREPCPPSSDAPSVGPHAPPWLRARPRDLIFGTRVRWSQPSNTRPPRRGRRDERRARARRHARPRSCVDHAPVERR